MRRAKDYRAAFLQEMARQTMSFLPLLLPGSSCEVWIFDGVLNNPPQHLSAGRALPDCCRDDRLTLGRVGVADPRGARGSVPRRGTCWGRLTLIQNKKKREKKKKRKGFVCVCVVGGSNTRDAFYFTGENFAKIFSVAHWASGGIIVT